MIQKVIIASKNPVKINAVKAGFQKMFPTLEFQFEGISSPSGVSEQPLSSKETKEGALNRIKNAKALTPNAQFWVGIEGGIEKIDEEMEVFAWIIISSKEKTGKAKTSTFYLPRAVTELIAEGKELGEADDMVFGGTNTKQKNGAVGILTGDLVNRTSYYTEAVILALIPFKNEELY
ncbi:non-canonical purine NTP phosphatase [Marivirga lumbricoides]|uniref:Probable inosine/xanthosine triphosphatase n=1 Tax=Marivirga lumbricoides TaxID=1046115 RepID=A0ABQ1LAN5_9BACT|nr:non-canonical purine NTP phosphatase [Marivirga lumbricoides]